MAEIGALVVDRYKILNLVGKGGMGEVYLAEDTQTGQQVAVKEYVNDQDDTFISFIDSYALPEYEMMKVLDHPVFPKMYDIIEQEEYVYIIMEYIQGETLGELVQREGAQPEKLIVSWMLTLCKALEYLHSQNPPIIHRDIKPGNIILTSDGDLRVIDFGNAMKDIDNTIMDPIAAGTRGYAAPEQYSIMGRSDVRTDIYGLGATMHHMVTGKNPGKPPYELYPIRRLNEKLSRDLEKIIFKCTMKNPDDRYQSCKEICRDLYKSDCMQEIMNKSAEDFARKTWKEMWDGIFKRSTKYITPDDTEKDRDLSIDSIRYYAQIVADVQKEDRGYSIIKGPDYDK